MWEVTRYLIWPIIFGKCQNVRDVLDTMNRRITIYLIMIKYIECATFNDKIIENSIRIIVTPREWSHI